MLINVEPFIKLTRSDADRLWGLARANLRGNPQLTSSLIGELARASIVLPDDTSNVVTMHSWVAFHYGLTDQIRRVQLVYPSEAKISEGKISVMTPIGVALIGLSEGQRIEWQTPLGSKRSLRVLKVLKGPQEEES